MKIIKSFLLLAIGLITANLLQAQEIKTQVLKQSEVKAPPASVVANMPSPAPELKPMNGVAVKEVPAAPAETPSPFTKDKNNNSNTPKTDAKQITPVISTDATAEKLTISLVPGPVVIKQE